MSQLCLSWDICPEFSAVHWCRIDLMILRAPFPLRLFQNIPHCFIPEISSLLYPSCASPYAVVREFPQ